MHIKKYIYTCIYILQMHVYMNTHMIHTRIYTFMHTYTSIQEETERQRQLEQLHSGLHAMLLDVSYGKKVSVYVHFECVFDLRQARNLCVCLF